MNIEIPETMMYVVIGLIFVSCVLSAVELYYKLLLWKRDK